MASQLTAKFSDGHAKQHIQRRLLDYRLPMAYTADSC